MTYPTGTRIASRIAAAERALHGRLEGPIRLNTFVLDAIDFDLGIDIWDGRLAPGDVEARYIAECERAAGTCGLRPDGTIEDRIARLRAEAAGTYRPD